MKAAQSAAIKAAKVVPKVAAIKASRVSNNIILFIDNFYGAKKMHIFLHE